MDSVRELASLFPVQGKNSPFFISSHTERDSRLLQKGMSRIICSLRKKTLGLKTLLDRLAQQIAVSR